LDLEGKKKQAIIAELVGLLAEADLISEPKQLIRELMKRERLSSTGIGDGIAIPHALSGNADRTVMAFGRKRTGAKFDAVDKQPVFLFFLLVGPKGAHTEHLKLLSKLSRVLHDPDLRKKLLAVDSAKEVIDLLRQREKQA
jgi:mannitol/fructose-specific phosphotransferase system IIA component (Ntr-type)